MSRIRPGRVAMIRINPKDCMAIVDTVKNAGLHIPGMSFAQATSIALGCAMETFRKHNVIPERDGFEYNAVMQEFPNNTNGRKVRQFSIQKSIESAGSAVIYPPAKVTPRDESNEQMSEEEIALREEYVSRNALPDPATHPDINVRRIYTRLKELDSKRNLDPVNFDQAEYDELSHQLGKLL